MACDWGIDSSAQEDRCGLCHGDGTQCNTIRGSYTETDGVGKLSIYNLLFHFICIYIYIYVCEIAAANGSAVSDIIRLQKSMSRDCNYKSTNERLLLLPLQQLDIYDFVCAPCSAITPAKQSIANAIVSPVDTVERQTIEI